MVITVSNDKQFFTKREVELANMAFDLQERIGWQASDTFIQCLWQGDIFNCMVTVDDTKKAYAIYGVSAPILKGRTIR